MNELKEIYDRITFLRGKGIKMKETYRTSTTHPERIVRHVFHSIPGILQKCGKRDG